MFLLPLTNRGTDGDGGEYAPSLLSISYLGSLGPKALRELRFFKHFFYIDRSLTAPLLFAPGSLSAYPYARTPEELLEKVEEAQRQIEDGGPLPYTQFKRVWQYIVTRSTKERTYVRYINGQKIQRTVTPKLGEKAAHNGNVVYTLDFQVTPHQLRHTYITNLIYSGADPKTVQYLAGHKHSKITMDIYAKVKYNKPEELSSVVNKAFAPKKGATPNKTRNG